MSAKQLIVISVLVLAIIVAFYFAFFRKVDTPVVGNTVVNGAGLGGNTNTGPTTVVVAKPPSDITGGSTTINLTGSSLYAKTDGVKVYSIYDNSVRKIAKKDEWLGTYNGIYGSNSTYINTPAGKSWVPNAHYYSKS